MTQNIGKTTKTVLIIRNAYGFDFGGGERMPIELASELQKHGYRPVIVSRSAKLMDFAKSKGLIAIKGWWWKFQDWSGIYLLFFPLYLLWQFFLTCWYLGLIIGTGASVVHLQSRDDFIAGTLAGKLLGKRIVWTDHADLKYIYRNVSIWYKNPVGKIVYWLSRRVRAVILVSQNEKTHIAESLNKKVPENYIVIYNGVSEMPVTKAKRPAKDKEAIIFVATSRLVTTKGIGELIEAFKAFNAEHKNTRLWLFGEGPEEAKFKTMADGNESITFWGFPENSLNLVAASDVFIHPSYHEGFSISLIEAAKLGLPIIACKVGGNPEIVDDGKNGLLVPPKNAVALAQAMESLFSDKQLRIRCAKTARETYEKNFVFETLVSKEFVPLYE